MSEKHGMNGSVRNVWCLGENEFPGHLGKEGLRGAEMSNETKYIWTTDFNDFSCGDFFDTAQECMNDAKIELNGEIEHVYMAEFNPFKPCVFADDVLEQIREQAIDECGEYGSDWHIFDPKKDKTDLEILSGKLTTIITEWLKSKDNMPTFGTLQGVRKMEDWGK